MNLITPQINTKIEIKPIYLVQIAAICTVNILFLHLIHWLCQISVQENALLKEESGIISVGTTAESVITAVEQIGKLQNEIPTYSSHYSSHYSLKVICFIAYVAVEVFILLYWRSYIIQNIYSSCITRMRNEVCYKYNIYDKSFVASDYFKEYVVQNCYLQYIKYALIFEVMLSMAISKDCRNNVVLIAAVLVLMYANLRLEIITQKNKHIVAIAIGLASCMLYSNTKTLIYTTYLVFQYASYKDDSKCFLNITPKNFGSQKIDWKYIITPSNEILQSGIYCVDHNVEGYLYDIANTYFHDKHFFLADDNHKIKYKDASPETWNIILIDNAFDEYDKDISILDNVMNIAQCSSEYVRSVYNEFGFTINLQSLPKEQYLDQMFSLISLCSPSKLILLPQFNRLPLAIQAAIQCKKDKIYIIAGRLEGYPLLSDTKTL